MPKRKKSHGGARQGAGRPAADPAEKKRPVSVWLTPAELEHCKGLGDGSIGDGIKALITKSMRRKK